MYIDLVGCNKRLNIVKTETSPVSDEILYDAEYFYNHWLKAIFTISSNCIAFSLDVSQKQYVNVNQLEYHQEFLVNVQKIFNELLERNFEISKNNWEN